MTTTQKIQIAKLNANRNSNKSIKYVVAFTIIIFATLCIVNYTSYIVHCF
jgi:hypothetical protein